LDALTRKPERLCVGVLSGTSADGVDAALCHLEGTGRSVRLALVRHATYPFSDALSARILQPVSAAELAELHFVLGGEFARAVRRIADEAQLPLSALDVIGSHGQTLVHQPPPHNPPSTLQLGEASVIAQETGVLTVSNFRARDVAVGGQGAPLVPYADWALFRSAGRSRALLNLGGIANVSVVSDQLEETLAFDTGPGNMLMDALSRRASGGRLRCDLDGALSRQGQPIPDLLQALLAHPYLALPPPKSTGRELFGEVLAGPLWGRFHNQAENLVATALAFTVESIARAVERHVLPRAPEALYVSGGGARHPGLWAALRERLAPLPLHPLDALGFPEAAKEAACFALLANEFLFGTAANVPSATGARESVVLGQLTP
jgi:anhydro-N-acetylmuramic acid kinase